MPDPPEAECLTIAVAGLVDWEGMPLTGVRQITFRRLEGDVSGDGRVSIFDLLAVRNNLGQPVTAANFRCDLDADGSVNLADLLAVRNRLHRTAPCAASRSRGGRVST